MVCQPDPGSRIGAMGITQLSQGATAHVGAIASGGPMHWQQQDHTHVLRGDLVWSHRHNHSVRGALKQAMGSVD